MKKNHAAFSLIELMVTLAVLAIVLAVGVPSFGNLTKDNRLVAQTNELVSAISTARTEAIKRSSTVTLCASADGATCKTTGAGAWESGWIVFADPDGDGVVDSGEQLLRVQAKLQSITVRSSLAAAPGRISYKGNGFKSNTDQGTLTLCDDRGAKHARGIVINATGRAALAIDSDSPKDDTVNHSSSTDTGNVSCP
jgi:type IV fimbrial biogenesis protein FimT